MIVPLEILVRPLIEVVIYCSYRLLGLQDLIVVTERVLEIP